MHPHLTRLYRSVFRVHLVAATLLLSLCAATLVRADEGGAGAGADAAAAVTNAAPKQKLWTGTATAGVTLTRGNSRNFLASGGLVLKRNWTNNEVILKANAGYGDTTTKVGTNTVTTTTDSYINGSGQYNHYFSPKFYAGLNVRGEHDDVAALAYRLTVSPLIGYAFIKEPKSNFAFELGPSYVREKFFDQSVDSYLGLRIGEHADHTFASGAKIWESLEYIPKVEDFSNYLLNAEAGVSAPMSKVFSLSLILQDTYKSVPAAGKMKNDLKLIAGLTYNF